MKIEARTYRITGITPMLGGQPADKELRSTYISSLAPTPEQGDEENSMLPNIDQKGLTVFLRRPLDDAMSLMDYMIVGFLKESVKALSDQNGIKSAASKVGTYVFVEPRIIPIKRDDAPVYEPSSVLERPLRIDSFPPRVALSASEMIDAPWEITFTIKLLGNNGTKASKAVTWDAIEDALDYGALKGLCQWRNGGYGRFAWERIDEGAKK